MSTLQKSTINGVHFGPIKKIALTPDKQYLLSLGSTDGIINVIDFNKFDISPDYNTALITDDQILTFSTNENRNSFIITDDGKQILNVNWPDISQTSKITETDTQMTVLATNSIGNLIAVSGEDPQITIINLDNPDDPTPLYDNLKTVVYIGFGPICQTLVIINEEGEILTYSAGSSYQEDKLQEVNVKTVLSGVCWSRDSQLLIADSEKKGIFHVFHFSSEGYTTGKFQNLGIITGLSISDSFLLAACDSSQKIVIAQYSESFIQNHQLPILHIFDPKTQTISILFWADDYLIAGDSEGSIHKWDKIEVENTKEIEVVTAVMESDAEIEEIESDDDHIDKISKTKHIIPTGKHKAEIPKSHQKQKSAELSGNEADYTDYDEEEDEEERRTRNPYLLDEASEASTDYDSDTVSSRKKRSDIPDFRPKISADDLAERIKQNLNIKEYSTTPTVTESESESEDPTKPISKEKIQARREEARREARLDRQFIVHSGSEVSEEADSGGEEEEETIEAVSDSEEDHLEVEDNEPIQFMPGSTDDFENKRRFLCFNLIAKIFLRENADESTSIDIEYNDIMQYKSSHFENKERYVLGTVTTAGVALASRSRVYYKPHRPWSTDCECQIKMENDEIIDLIAAGNDWFAVSTNLKRLRVFMASGLEIAIIAIPQRPMTMTGGDDFLFIVYGDKYNEDLTFQLIDVKKRRLLAKGLLPISKIVNWIGYDDRTFYILGNNHILYALVNDYGYQFVPSCNAQPKDINNNDDDDNITAITDTNSLSEFWAVGVNNNTLLGVYMPVGRKYPEPVKNLKLESILIEPQCADEESRDYLFRRISYCNSTKSGKEENAIKMDKELLKMFAQAIKKRNYSKMLQIGYQITSKNGRNITLSIIKQKGPEFVDVANQLEELWGSTHTENEEEEANENEQQQQEQEQEQYEETNNDNNGEEQNEEFNNDNNVEEQNENYETNYNEQDQQNQEIDNDNFVEEVEVIEQKATDEGYDSAVVRDILQNEGQIIDDEENEQNIVNENSDEKEQNNDENSDSGKEESVNDESDENADSVAEDDDSIEE